MPRAHFNPALGSRVGTSKLDEHKVASARSEYVPYSRTHGIKPLARKYDVNRTTMSLAVRGDTWMHVKP